MIYTLSGTSQNHLSARVSIKRPHRCQYTLAQRRHIVTLVDRAMQEGGIPFIRAAENLQLQVSAHSVCRWCVALQDHESSSSQWCHVPP